MSLALFVLWCVLIVTSLYCLWRWPVAVLGIPSVFAMWTLAPIYSGAAILVVVVAAVGWRTALKRRPRRSLLPAIPRRVVQPVQAHAQPPARVDTRPCACGGVITASQAGRLASIACDSCDSPAFLLPSAG